MSDWHFGMDYDMWLYPPVDWKAPDYNYELPEPIEAANIEGALLVNAEDAIEQVRRLQAENAALHESLDRAAGIIVDMCGECPVSRYEWLSSDGCAEKCGTVTEDECWTAYLTGKRWDESEVEANA